MICLLGKVFLSDTLMTPNLIMLMPIIDAHADISQAQALFCLGSSVNTCRYKVADKHGAANTGTAHA